MRLYPHTKPPREFPLETRGKTPYLKIDLKNNRVVLFGAEVPDLPKYLVTHLHKVWENTKGSWMSMDDYDKGGSAKLGEDAIGNYFAKIHSAFGEAIKPLKLSPNDLTFANGWIAELGKKSRSASRFRGIATADAEFTV